MLCVRVYVRVNKAVDSLEPSHLVVSVSMGVS
jgi:hypothetical protein